MTGSVNWAQAAAAAEKAVTARQLRRLLPGAVLGLVGWPANISDRLFVRWHYWWQAHLVDCLIDAQLRSPTPERLRQLRALVRGIRWRNGFRWTNSYYDDIAWLGLALQRAAHHGFLGPGPAVARIISRLHDGWNPVRGGGIAWNTAGAYFNAPANGPAGILMARIGDPMAGEISDWTERRLADPVTGLIFDGVGADAAAILNTDLYTYCQGAVLGLETELALRDDATGIHLGRARRLIDAIDEHLAVGGVLIGHGGGNGGLFSGIAIRYLAQAAQRLDDPEASAVARRLVTTSAEALWRGRAVTPTGPLFAADWSVAAGVAHRSGSGRRRPDGAESSVQPERDLSVQLGAWMTLEAAAMLQSNPDVNRGRG